MKPVIMTGEDAVPAKALIVSRYIIKPNFDSSTEPRKRDLTAAREVHIEPSTVQGGRRVRGAFGIGRRSDSRWMRAAGHIS